MKNSKIVQVLTVLLCVGSVDVLSSGRELPSKDSKLGQDMREREEASSVGYDEGTPVFDENNDIHWQKLYTYIEQLTLADKQDLIDILQFLNQKYTRKINGKDMSIDDSRRVLHTLEKLMEVFPISWIDLYVADAFQEYVGYNLRGRKGFGPMFQGVDIPRQELVDRFEEKEELRKARR